MTLQHPKKILFIIDDLGRGGAEKITSELANYLSHLGHCVSIAVLNSSNKTQELATSLHFIDLEIRTSFAFGKLWKKKFLNEQEKIKIQQTINQKNFDLIILGHHNGYYLYDELRQKDQTWLWVHAELLEFRPAKNPLKLLKEYIRQIRNKKKFKFVFNKKQCITVNRDLASRYKELVPNSVFKTIANGVADISYTTDPAPLAKKWDCIFVGRLVAIKQVDHAIRAFAQSKLTGKMAIIGDGPELEKLRHLTQTLQAQDKIEFLGWINDPKPYMLQSKCLIMSSYYEGSPVTLAEAITLSVPVVSYNSSAGIEDIFSPQFKPHCLVEKQNIAELSTKLQNIVNHPFQFDQESRQNVSIGKMAENFLKLIP